MPTMRRRRFLTLAACLLAGSRASAAVAAPMPEQDFWRIIEAVKKAAGADVDARPALLQRQLMALTPPAIEGFQQRYEALLLQADRWDLWGAADLMNGGCSDDGFKYFRDWLISEGEHSYRAALAQPDSLASFAPREFFELEAFGYAAAKADAAQGGGRAGARLPGGGFRDPGR